MRAELNRAEVLRLLNVRPFRPFVITLDSNQQLVVEHPENIAFDPTPGGRADFYMLGAKLRCFSTFDAITMIATLDQLINNQNGLVGAA